MREQIKTFLKRFRDQPTYTLTEMDYYVDEIIKTVRNGLVNRDEHKLQRIVSDEKFIREARSIPKPITGEPGTWLT